MPAAADRTRGQHHKRLAVVTALALVLALAMAIGGMILPPGETLWHRLAAPDEDGAWRFVTIDGVDVRDDGYSLFIRWRAITGYHDGCNSCGFDGEAPAGSRTMMTCTLVDCAPRPHDPLFARFAHGDPVMAVRGDRLILTLPGHRAELVRAPEPD